MKTYRQQLIITSEQTEQFLNLSYEIEECGRRSLINDGICDREELFSDWSAMLSKIVPTESQYKVDYSSAGAAHMKQMLLGSSVTVPITDGRLELGPRQYIMYGDFDGCREKTVIVKIIGE